MVRISGSHPGGPGSIPGNGIIFDNVVYFTGAGFITSKVVARFRFRFRSPNFASAVSKGSKAR